MNDLDLEEIESHLYSQIYHSNEDSDVIPVNLPSENFQEPENMKKPNRYFRSNPRSGGTKFQNKHLLAGQHNLKAPPRSDYYQQQQGIYSKSYERPQKRDISINQLVVLSTPQQPPIVCVSNSNSRNKRAKWRAKLKEKRRKQRLAEKLINSKPSKPNCVKEDKVTKPETHDVITLSDSEEESCVELPNNWPVVSVMDSDDDDKNALKQETDNEPAKGDYQTDNLTDDVIFIEPVNAPVEVINLDEETEKNSDVSVETASVASTNSFPNSSPSKSQLTKSVHQERKELLSTPDSASNDFMTSSGSVDLNQASFNFSLHGKDFDNDKFIKPPNPTEHCETESSSSTTDNNTVNMMKTAVFNEIEFPKEDIFSEANLESFGNLITPSRKNTTKDSIRASTPVEESSRKQDQNLYSSDSSSESDFEEPLDKQKELLKSSKNLPDLSPMTSEMRHSPQQLVTKKNKKSNLSSKYDLIEAISEQKTKQKKRKSAQSNEVASEPNPKKKHKSKKRKTDMEVTNNEEENNASLVPAPSENETETNIFDQSIDSGVKRKSRKSSPRSSPFLDDSSENLDGSEGRKKAKTKKKKSFSTADSEDNVESQKTSADSSDVELGSCKEQIKTGTKKKKSSSAGSEDNVADVESQQTSGDSSAVELSSSKEQTKTGTKKRKSFSAGSEDNATDVESQQTSADSSAVELSSSKEQTKTGTKKKKSSSADSEDNAVGVESQKIFADSSTLELSLNQELTKAGDSLENLDQSQPKKKTKIKKKKSLSGAESEDNVTDIEPTIPAQEASVESHFEELNNPTENTLPCDNVKIKTEKIDDQTTDQTNQKEGTQLEVAVKTEDSETNVNLRKLETVEAKVAVTTEENVAESGDSVQMENPSVVEEVKTDCGLVVLTDSDSNLSELMGQQDIQLNLEEPTTPNRNTSSSIFRNPAINLVDNTLEEVQRTMSNDPKLWTILDSDRMPTRPSVSNRRCNRCRERGHTGIRCPNKVVPKCKLCGESGHFEPRCPNRICTQCGAHSNYSTTYCRFCFQYRKWKCPICYLIGHKADSCPDLWRRYHLTTTDGPLKNHTGPSLKPRNQLWCSGCARSGHLENSCRFYQSVYPPSDPSIKRYDNIYENYAEPNEQRQAVSSQPVIPFETNQFAGRNCLLPTPPFLPQNQPFVYNQSSSYHYPMGPMPISPLNRQVWINQGNMFPPRENQLVHDINIYPPANPSNSQGYYEFNFEDKLPNFISFEPPPPSNNYGNVPSTSRYFNNNAIVDEMRNNFASNRPPRPINQNDGVDEMRDSFVTNRPPRPINQNDGVDEIRDRPPRPISQNDGVDEVRNNFVANRPPRPINQNDDVDVDDETINTFLANVPRHQMKHQMSVFFSSSFANIQNFISGELAKLVKVSLKLKNIVGSLRKLLLEPNSASKMKKYHYRKLNMVLFGIYQLNEGGKHLIRLKNCRLQPKTSKLSQQRRQDLFRSYCYIFGNQKQANYIKLLRKI